MSTTGKRIEYDQRVEQSPSVGSAGEYSLELQRDFTTSAKTPATKTLKTFDPQFAALASISAATEKAYGLRFFSPADLVVAAPGRVNLIGEHVDYNDGFVLPMAIDRYTVIAGSVLDGEQMAGRQCKVYAADLDQEATFDLDQPILPPTVQPDWIDYIRGVFAGFQQRSQTIPALNLVVKSAVPLGSGLSSSAALEVAVATFLQNLLKTDFTQQQLALICQEAEHKFAKVPCGIMDQFSSVFGQEDHLMLLDCRDQSIQQVPFAGQEVAVLIANTNVKHALTGGEYAERRQQCDEALKILGQASYRDVALHDLESRRSDLSDVLYLRARHVVTEIQRTQQAAAAISGGDWQLAGQLMYASHLSLKDDFQVSCAELDAMVQAAKEVGPDRGVIGSRMTGGGFGGCTVSLVRQAAAESLSVEIGQRYKELSGIDASIFVSRPSRGAHLVVKEKD